MTKVVRRGTVLAMVAAVVALSWSANAAAATTFVQGVAKSSSGSSLTLSIANVRAGDLLVGMVRAGGGATVSDNLNGTWSRAILSGDGVNGISYLAGAKAGTTTLTISGTSGPVRAVIAEYSGVATTSALAGTSCGTGTSTTPYTGQTGALGSGLLAFAGVGTYVSPETITASGGPTLRTTLTDANGSGADEDYVTSQEGTGKDAAFTLSQSADWAACIAVFNPSTAGTGGNGKVLFDGKFVTTGNGAGPSWPSVYGSCTSPISTTQIQFNITTSCNPGADGHYRTDLCSSPNCDHDQSSGDFYVAGQGTCTSVPVRAPNGVGAITTWMMVAEAKDNEAQFAGWAFNVGSYWSGTTPVWDIGVINGNDPGNGSLRSNWDGPVVDTNWHTLSICTNSARDNTGQIYSIWFDGIQQAFNHGPCAGQQSCGGFPIINDGVANWPLDINDYTGGTPVPNTIVHGDPLIATIGSNGKPPEPPGGWNSP